MVVEELQQIGLTSGEAKAYLALLELGSTTVGPVARKTKISYSKIYEVLSRLIDKGFVSIVVRNNVKYFQAATPRQLYSYMDQQEQSLITQRNKLRKLIPQLELLEEAYEKENVQVFYGLRGLRTAYDQLYIDSKRGDTSLFFYVHKEEYLEQSDNFYLQYSSIIRKKGIRFLGISSNRYHQSKIVKGDSYPIDMRYVSFPTPGNIDIYKNKVLQITWGEKILGILIESKEIAQDYRAYFEEVWKQGKK